MTLLAHQKDEVAFSVRAALARTERESGKSALAQCVEQVRLARDIGLLTPQEYFGYRLYDDAHYQWEDKRRFIGLTAQKRISAWIANRRWSAVQEDKIVYTGLMRSHGLPVPRIRGVFHPYRSVLGAAALASAADLRSFLRDAGNYPMFCKPNDGIHSVGTTRLDRYDPSDDTVVAHDGERCTVDAFVADVARYLQRGYLFQEVQRPHDQIARVCGNRIATVRIITLLEASGPEIFETLWKVPTGRNVADNFWRRGNVVAHVDQGTGRVTRAVTGLGHDQREIEQHPDSGALLKHFVLPEWDRTRALALAASTTLPGIRMQAWDIAICSEGPVLIEVNAGGDYILLQVASGRGILNERFRRLLAETGYVHRKPWVGLGLRNALQERLKSIGRRLEPR